MAKYAHTNLIRFIKSDAKRIKNLNPDLKNTDITNVLSTYFGWRHFNELKKNLDKDEILYCDSLTKIQNLKYPELKVLKTGYFNFINKKFPLENMQYDHYNIINGGFGRLKNKTVTFIKKIDNAPIIDISLLHGETYIKLSNEDFVNFIQLNTKYVFKNEKHGMWEGRVNYFMEAIWDAFRKDPNNINYQERLIEFFEFKNIEKYFFEHENMKECDKLADYIYNLPGYIRPYTKDGQTFTYKDIKNCESISEQHGFLVMSSYYLLKQNYFNFTERTKHTLNLSEIRSFKGSVRVTHYDNSEHEKNLSVLAGLLI